MGKDIGENDEIRFPLLVRDLTRQLRVKKRIENNVSLILSIPKSTCWLNADSRRARFLKKVE